MPIPLSPEETWEYQLVDDRLPDKNDERHQGCKPDKTKAFFTFRAPTPTEDASIEDDYVRVELDAKTGAKVRSMNLGTRRNAVLCTLMTGWRNFPPEFKKDDRGRCAEANLAYIGPVHLYELAGAALARIRVTVDESD